ncbi:MAG: hypothetical protein B6I20_11880 [Bacteroidetes bacterium 4572_117]|nr:MAG: hypothetical protein B6I20_11880 [Bacteroidetes bacterium 4572_117]
MWVLTNFLLNKLKLIGRMEKNIHDGGCILIVEDDYINYMYLSEILEGKGYKFIHACNGEESVDICQHNNSIKLILMDIKMPIMNGYTASTEIKIINPEVKIVAQTAYTETELTDRAFDGGFDDYILKPIPEEKLLQIVDKYFKM